MAPSPFAKLEGAMFLGAKLENFSCIQCGEDGQTFLAAGMGDPDCKPSIVWTYVLCGRCASQYWDEAGEKFMKIVREAVCGED